MWALRPVRASCGTLGGSFSAVWTRRTSPAMLMRLSIIVFSVLLFSVLQMLGSVQPKASCVYSMNGMCVSCENMAVFTK